MRIGLFIPCLVDQFFPQAGLATARILRRLGHTVEYPAEQTCCGQPAYNSGVHREARALARRFLRVFDRFDAIVAPSGSCVAMVRNIYPQLLDLTHHSSLITRVFEFSEFLVTHLGVTDLGASFNGRVAYHDSCHLLRELRVQEQPRQLLRAVRGLELVELNDGPTCCGFGGSFSVKFPQISTAMGGDKLAAIERTGAGCVVAGDAGCLMHIGGLLRRRGSTIKPVHLAALLGGLAD
ncbi:MAG: (Fe-S)-binding protein [Verrucomicrobia bacterium]|nr:(Fe-S)-binding protein [Verrucomicrobiota bacterium]